MDNKIVGNKTREVKGSPRERKHDGEKERQPDRERAWVNSVASDECQRVARSRPGPLKYTGLAQRQREDASHEVARMLLTGR